MTKIINAAMILLLLCAMLLCASRLFAENPLDGWSAWRDASQKTDDRHDKEICDLRQIASENKSRLSSLEAKMTLVQEDVASLATTMWAGLVGIVALVLNALWSVVQPRLERSGFPKSKL